MIFKMRPSEDGGSRIAIVFNGSPLFTGDAESGESNIRRWIIENDWLEAIVALPDQLFYNTGISNFILAGQFVRWMFYRRLMNTTQRLFILVVMAQMPNIYMVF
jgi:hypothetical protein